MWGLFCLERMWLLWCRGEAIWNGVKIFSAVLAARSLPCIRALTTISKVSSLALALSLLLLVKVVAGQETNARAWMLPTNSPSFFFADHLTGATYYQFSPDGTYVLTAKEHMGVWPTDGGNWIQASDGAMTLTSTNAKRAARGPEVVKPMQYKDKVFLIWPSVSYKADLAEVVRFIDSPTNSLPLFNELKITEEEFRNGVGKPYAFKFYPEMNKATGAE